MSKPTDIERLGGDVFRKSRTRRLRERMQEFIDEHGSADLEAVREGISGTPVSEIVDDERDERV